MQEASHHLSRRVPGQTRVRRERLCCSITSVEGVQNAALSEAPWAQREAGWDHCEKVPVPFSWAGSVTLLDEGSPHQCCWTSLRALDSGGLTQAHRREGRHSSRSGADCRAHAGC